MRLLWYPEWSIRGRGYKLKPKAKAEAFTETLIIQDITNTEST